jgi:dolichol-phosphate mannosyltransferase
MRAAGILRLPDVRRAKRADWIQLIRFLVVGSSGYAVNLAVFSVALALGAHYTEAAIVAFFVAWTSNFVLNRYWTFDAGHRPALRQGVKYLLVSLIALGANLVVLHFLIEAGLAETPAQALAILLVTPVSFLLSRRWSFAR